MTENEAINELQANIDLPFGFTVSDEVSEIAIQALEEIQQYRAIGTVEDMAFYKKCYDEESYEYCGEYGTDNCGCKDRMEHLEKKIAEFEAIGTIEEFKALKDAEEQGLLKILPVAIGSDVYYIPSKVNYELNVLHKHEENNRVYHQQVARIVFNNRGWYLELDKNLEYGVDHILVDKFYKETWFTDESEAEQALAEMKGVKE